MQIVIDIPEEVYKSIQDNDYCGISNADMYNAVKNGTPLLLVERKLHNRMQIELVIKIPEKWFDDMVREEFEDVDELCAVIQHGIQLPKGHGRLIDADDIALIDEQFYVPSDYYVAESAIDDAPTIIDAESEE